MLGRPNTASMPHKLRTMSAPIVGLQSSITAAGTTQATAFDLSGYVGVAVVTTSVTGSASGVQLPVAVPGQSIVVVNSAAVPVLVYPQLGGSINGLSANASYSLAPSVSVEFMNTSGLGWAGIASGSPASSGISSQPLLNVSAATTLTAAQSGLTIGINTNASTAYTVTLPAPAAGLYYMFRLATATLAHAVTVAATGALCWGGSIANDATAVTTPLSATKTTNNIFGTSSVVNDSLRVECIDGVNWACNSQSALHGAFTVS